MRKTIIIELNGKVYEIDLNKGIDISIPVKFDGERLQAFRVPAAESHPYSGEGFVLDVNQGAGCNCPVFIFSAHLHGTHTECVGHISSQNHIVQDVVGHQNVISALLVTVEPVSAQNCGEGYILAFSVGDKVITRAALEKVLKAGHEALIIRTLPNNDEKKTRNYIESPWPFFTNEAMELIAGSGIRHLLLDMPSVDREEDEGRLSNHHIFWNVPQGSNDVPDPSPRSITELIYVPPEIQDGLYALNLNIGNIRADAAPSRPVLYKMEVRS